MRNLAEAGTIDDVIGQSEVGDVEEVEELAAKLQGGGLGTRLLEEERGGLD